MELVSLWEVLCYQLQEFAPHVGTNICAIWWIEPCDISVSVLSLLPFSIFLRFCVLKVPLVTTVFQGFDVRGRCSSEDFLI